MASGASRPAVADHSQPNFIMAEWRVPLAFRSGDGSRAILGVSLLFLGYWRSVQT